MAGHRTITVLQLMLGSCHFTYTAAAAVVAASRCVPRMERVVTIRHHSAFNMPRSSANIYRNVQLTFAHSLQSSASTKRFISKSFIRHQQQNRYDRFRLCLDSNLESNHADLMTVAKSTMEMLSSNRRSFHRTWGRMGPLLELIVTATSIDQKNGDGAITLSTHQSTPRLTSIADVGCDHGLLSLSLACMAWSSLKSLDRDRGDNSGTTFISSVTGSDVSSNALSGALLSLEKLKESISYKSKANDGSASDLLKHAMPIDFRIGNGLSTLRPGEADGIILAGMGVHTMLNILTTNNDLNKLDTNYLFLQPTNSRPRHLLLLYDTLQKGGLSWELMNENIAFLGGRWYVNAHFKRQQSKESKTFSDRMPGHFLKRAESGESKSAYDTYVFHHIQWLEQDYNNRGALEENDERWIQHILYNDESNLEWRDACSWYKRNSN